MRFVRDFSVASRHRRQNRPRAQLNFATGFYRLDGAERSFADLVAFSRASAAVRQTEAGQVQTVAANTARFDFGWPGAAPLGLLIEPAATNIVRQNSKFDTAPWARARLITTPGAAGPDGGTAAMVLTRSSTTETAFANNICGAPTVSTYTASVYAKAGSLGGRFGLRMQGAYPRRGDAVFDLLAGTVIGANSSSTNTATTATIAPLANGWHRCTVTTTFVLAESASVSVVLGPTHVGAANATWEAPGPLSDVIVWGTQVETGSVATSLIATDATVLTRAGDSAGIVGITGTHDVALTYGDGSTATLAAVAISTGWWPVLTWTRLRTLVIS